MSAWSSEGWAWLTTALLPAGADTSVKAYFCESPQDASSRSVWLAVTVTVLGTPGRETRLPLTLGARLGGPEPNFTCPLATLYPLVCSTLLMKTLGFVSEVAKFLVEPLPV